MALSDDPPVAILVLNFNGKHFLGNCFRTLGKTRWPNNAYLVDNGSQDGSVEYVRTEFPEVRIIQFERNYGFCEGYNRAIKQVHEKYILFLNNDTEAPDPDWLANMMRVVIHDDKVGVVGPKLVSVDNSRILDAVGGQVWRWGGIGVRIGAGEEDMGQYDRPPIEPFCVLGAAMLIRRDLFLESGGFDEAMFAYSDELDLCWRLRLKGYGVKYCPEAVILHHSSGSWGKMKGLKLYLSSRNFLRSCLKNYSVRSLLKDVPALLAVSVLGTFAAGIFAKNPSISISGLRGIVWNMANFRDTLKQRTTVQRSRVTDEASIIAAMDNTRTVDMAKILSQLRA